MEQSIHYLIRSAFLILKLKAANVSDATNVQRHLKEKSVPSADLIAVFPSDSGMAPSKTPCGQMYLQKNGSPIPTEFVTNIGRRITKTMRIIYFRYLSGFSRAVENFFPGIL